MCSYYYEHDLGFLFMKGLPHLFNYDNPPSQPHNTCGQAVIATALDLADKNPYGLTRTHHSALDDGFHYPPAELLGLVLRDFGPNWPVRGGITVRKQILRALRSYDIPFNEVVNPPLRGAKPAVIELTGFINKHRRPVIVLIDTHTLGMGPLFTLHWCMVYAYDETHVHIASWGKNFSVEWPLFVRAWRCWFVTWPYNYYQIQL